MNESFTGSHILVVDDNEVNRDVLQLRLELQGYRVMTAEGGAEAVELLLGVNGSCAVDFDAVLLDIMMPEVSGLDVLRQVRRHHTVGDLPIIMQTAKGESEDVVEALSLGANDYVTKPIDFPVLFARLETQLRLRRLSAEKDEFLAIASHDLKNPLAVVRGYARLLPLMVPEGQPMTGEGLDLVHRIARQTYTMERIVNDFLDFQAMQEGRLALAEEPVDLRKIAQEVTDSMAEYARQKQISVSVRPSAPDLAPITGDSGRLTQIIENLINNAIKYGPPGTTVEVRIANSGEPLGGRKAVLFEVVDSGPGIPEGEMPRLFKKFNRLSNRPTGGEKSSGVGLAICKRLVEMHGGEIGARNNTPDPGATFWVLLPAG